ncbi:MAG: hypothetical protein WBA93_04375 [Microcoleaceae cyanobacterium]
MLFFTKYLDWSLVLEYQYFLYNGTINTYDSSQLQLTLDSGTSDRIS